MFVKIIDNFLPKTYFNYIKSEVTSKYFPWYYFEDITKVNSDKFSFLDNHGFNHCIVDDVDGRQVNCEKMHLILSGFYSILFEETKTQKVIKCRLDMTLRTNSSQRHQPHVDVNRENVTSIFYITDSDGVTEIYNEMGETWNPNYVNGVTQLSIAKIIEPKENRLVFFDGRYLHTGHSPTKNKNRILLNTVLV